MLEQPRELRVVETHRRRPPLDLPRVEQRGKTRGHVVEDPLAALLLRLDPFPVLPHPPGRARLDIAEDVRMAPYQLVVHRPRHLLEVAGAFLLQQQREEVDLEEQVAELVEQFLAIAGERRVRYLVGLLDGMRDDRASRLLAVPGTVTPQPLGQLL